ncbi:hypothetical protein ERIC1_1c23320 [Paenibacillus larvae subsp. larvae DSM 25719]|nr:hypothetical protein BXP28_15725 [Paenibacillus larvae subsp. larvae]ETK28844.1 hypothetical protein ERIC1_1c23320 [Paenibacillus larvae subsp. larvae DSM 25719]
MKFPERKSALIVFLVRQHADNWKFAKSWGRGNDRSFGTNTELECDQSVFFLMSFSCLRYEIGGIKGERSFASYGPEISIEVFLIYFYRLEG